MRMGSVLLSRNTSAVLWGFFLEHRRNPTGEWVIHKKASFLHPAASGTTGLKISIIGENYMLQ